MDFFTVPTVTFPVLYCFFVISHGRWRILHFNATEHPTNQWIVKQLREAFPEDRAPRYLVLDRDRKFSGEVRTMLECLGRELIRTASGRQPPKARALPIPSPAAPLRLLRSQFRCTPREALESFANGVPSRYQKEARRDSAVNVGEPGRLAHSSVDDTQPSKTAERVKERKMRTTNCLRGSIWLVFVLLGVFPVVFLPLTYAPSSTSLPASSSGEGGGRGGGSGGGGGQAIPASFFAMTIPAGGATYPTVSVGALGHPSTLAWAFIERSPGKYVFTGFDGYVNAAVQHGLVDSNGVAEVTITFGYTPMWAAADTSRCTMVGPAPVCPSPPANITDWTDFVTAVINHYNGTTAPHVKYYELWNEFSSPTFWTGTIQDMVNLAAAAYPVIHTDPIRSCSLLRSADRSKVVPQPIHSQTGSPL
jgi:hypothetical protein